MDNPILAPSSASCFPGTLFDPLLFLRINSATNLVIYSHARLHPEGAHLFFFSLLSALSSLLSIAIRFFFDPRNE
jgi:hypothetical protein